MREQDESNASPRLGIREKRPRFRRTRTTTRGKDAVRARVANPQDAVPPPSSPPPPEPDSDADSDPESSDSEAEGDDSDEDDSGDEDDGGGIPPPGPTAEDPEQPAPTSIGDAPAASQSTLLTVTSTGVPETTTAPSNEGAIPDLILPSISSTPSDEAGSEPSLGSDGDVTNADESNQGSTGPNRGKDAGIAIGTLAAVAFLVALGILLYRRRRKQKQGANDGPFVPLGGEKGGPPDIFETGVGGNPSWDQLMISRTRELNNAQAQQQPQQQRPTSDYGYWLAQEDKETMAPAAHKRSVSSLSDNNADGPGPQDNNYWPSRTSLSPPPPPPPPPVAAVAPPRLDIYPPGQVPIDHFPRQSVAQSVATDTTESTWKTWGFPQKRESGGRQGWRQRFLS